MNDFVLCSNCFHDQGLRLDAERIGVGDDSSCMNCAEKTGLKLSKHLVSQLSHRFFVWGTMHRGHYGAAPVLQFNEHQSTTITVPSWLRADLVLIEKAIGVGFFYYGPRLWMVGEVEPLKDLQDQNKKISILKRILLEYSTITLNPDQKFYRIRKNPLKKNEFSEYDSPPPNSGAGRLDSEDLPIMYCSQDLQICIHECRVSAEDEIFCATLQATKNLKLLDLTDLLCEKDVTEFESLDMAVHMLFLAGKHSYEITREIALYAHAAGFDGLIYPSYFSLLRTGGMPFETAYGISLRRFPQTSYQEKLKIIPNLALFGRPLEQGHVSVQCINKLILRKVEYDVHFGPTGY
ncbi:MAG TPA: RES family NAD+ phosphorylase [Stellaceae bacterium]|nr:RES family NAD+ phosphorylase [Stellaceae bacterium]